MRYKFASLTGLAVKCIDISLVVSRVPDGLTSEKKADCSHERERNGSVASGKHACHSIDKVLIAYGPLVWETADHCDVVYVTEFGVRDRESM